MADEISDALASLGVLKVGDFVHSELPSDVIASIEKLVDAFSTADAEQKHRIVRGVHYTFSFVFFSYAGRAAVESVRQKRPDLLRRGLLALGIENCTFDARDSLRTLVKIYNSTRKFPQVDAAKLFEDAARISCAPFSATLSDFISRPEEQKSLAAFGLKESTPPAPFDYEAMGAPVEQLSSKVRMFWRQLRRRLLGGA
jgi:hypothetical protein